MKTSVVICCFNSASRITPTLEALSFQKTNCEWEIILVDNNSKDNTIIKSQKIWNELNANIPFRIVKEINSGLSSARKTGVLNAKGELIIFCDDDNHLDPMFVQNAVSIMENDNNIGALCGLNEPLTEIELPDIVKKHISAYACGHFGMQTQYLEDKTVPWGAGLVVKRAFLSKLYDNNFESLLSDRKGKELSSGGDTEFCYILKLLGYKWKYDTRLKLKHAIPTNRLNEEYLKKLYFGFGKADAVIEWYYGQGHRNRITATLIWVKVYIKQKLFFKKHAPKDQFQKEWQKGYLDQLWNDKKTFNKKRKSVKTFLKTFNVS